MKKKLSLLTIAAICVAVISACKQGPSGPDNGQSTYVSPSPAHPELTYYGAFSSHGTSYSAIYVMDSDGNNQTAVQIAGSTQIRFGTPGWSPSGGSICFAQYEASQPDMIQAIDVSLNASDEPVGSKPRAIIGLADTTQVMKAPVWSSTSSMGMIAYSTNDGATESLWVVQQSGGAPTKIFSVDTGWVHYGSPFRFCTWSPDDSRLAVCRASLGSSNPTTIMIFNTSTWAYVDSLALTGWVSGLEWSRAGLNKLAFGMSPSSSDPCYLYYCDPTTGAAPVTNGVVGQFPTWSPNNSSIMYYLDESSTLYANVKFYGTYKVIPFTPFISEVCSSIGPVKWKR